MLHLLYSNQYSIKHYYKYRTETAAEIRHNHLKDSQLIHDSKCNLWQHEITVHDTQMQSKNWFTSKIKLSFNYHKVMFIHSLNAVFVSLTLKKNEYRNTKCSSENTFFYKLLTE